jgi:ribonuclease P protein component
LTDSPEFERVYRRGSAHRGKLFSVHTFPNELDTARLGLSVSKKVGNAVVRNTVRRRFKEIFRDLATEAHGLDVVVSAKPSSAEASYGELREEFERSLRKLASRPKRK